MDKYSGTEGVCFMRDLFDMTYDDKKIFFSNNSKLYLMAINPFCLGFGKPQGNYNFFSARVTFFFFVICLRIAIDLVFPLLEENAKEIGDVCTQDKSHETLASAGNSAFSNQSSPFFNLTIKNFQQSFQKSRLFFEFN